MPLSENNIESELSYAYLHAIASRAGLSCVYTNRHEDNEGIDARIRFLGDCGGLLTDVALEIQLKATRQKPPERDGVFSYDLTLKHYDKLRKNKTECQLLLVVLFLPEDPNEWLLCTDDELALRKCAYWVSLRGATPSLNKTSETVYIQRKNSLSVESLKELILKRSNEEYIGYEY